MTNPSNGPIEIGNEFFEEYSLYRKLKIELPEVYTFIEIPEIRLFCPICDSENTFVSNHITLGHRHQHPSSTPKLVADKLGTVTYVCASCHDYRQSYFLYFDLNLSYIMKIGQYPAWSTPIERYLEEVLGIYKSMYRKGLVCESQGYGIGAYAYYKRIIENIIDRLLGLAGELLEDDRDVRAYQKALEQTRKNPVAEDKIAIVKDLLPKSAGPHNMNPLSVLYDNLRAGIYAQTDAEYLEIAGSIREVLVFLIKFTDPDKKEDESVRGFTGNMRRPDFGHC